MLYPLSYGGGYELFNNEFLAGKYLAVCAQPVQRKKPI
jgi:hypothetical protein